MQHIFAIILSRYLVSNGEEVFLKIFKKKFFCFPAYNIYPLIYRPTVGGRRFPRIGARNNIRKRKNPLSSP